MENNDKAWKPGDERRRHKRYPVSLDGKIRVPLSEQGDVALTARITIQDLSTKGARVHVHALKNRHIPALLHKRRKCLLVCRLPDGKTSSILPGEVVWTDIRSAAEVSQVFMGIELTETEPDEQKRLDQFLQTLAKSATRNGNRKVR